MTELSLYTDGGSRSNPGPAATGGVIKDENGKIIETFGTFLGVATNNQAEYRALIEGLGLALKHKPTRLKCYLDSKLVVEQSLGRWKSKNAELRPHIMEIQKILCEHPEVTLEHVRREQNKDADMMVNQTLDANI